MPEVSGGKDEFSTVIGADAQFKGELTFQGGVRVDGQLEGTIHTTGKVHVSKGGKLKAEVKAGGISVEGHVDGNLIAEDRIELRATAQLRGDLKAAKLLVTEGASFVGRCEVGVGSLGVGPEVRPNNAAAGAAVPPRAPAMAGAR